MFFHNFSVQSEHGSFSSWQFLVSISLVSVAVATLVQKILLKDDESDPVAYSIVFQGLVAIIIGIYTLFAGFHMPNIAHYWPNFIVMIILYTIAGVFSFKSIHFIEASEFIILYATRSLWTIFTAFAFLGEHFLPLQFVGTFLVLFSVVMVSYREGKFVFNKGTWWGLIAAAATGIAFVNDAYVVRGSDVASYEVLGFLLPALATWIIYPKSTKHMKKFFHGPTFLKMFLFSSLYAVAAFAIYSAYAVARNAAELIAISQISTILTVLLAVIILKETSHLWKKLIAAVVAFVGVVLIGK